MYRKPKLEKVKDWRDPLKHQYLPHNATGLVVSNEGYDIFVYREKHNIYYFVGRKVRHSADNGDWCGVTAPFYDMHWNVKSLGDAKLMIYRLIKYYEKGYDVYKPNFKGDTNV